MSTNLLDMSLGEIIQRNKGALKKKGKKKPAAAKSGSKETASKPRKVQSGRVGKTVKKRPPPTVADARLKIIQKNRSQMGDARERLNLRLRTVDARSRISPKVRRHRAGAPIPRKTVGGSLGTLSTNPQLSRFRQGLGAPLQLSRTVRNATVRPPMLCSGSAYMDIVQRPLEPDWTSRMQALPRLEIHVPTIREREPLLLRTHMDVESNNWNRPMKAAPQVAYRPSRDYVKSRLEPTRQQEGYRIVVSNLQPSVTHEDIKELFEDVGFLSGSRVVRPGTAEVVYKNLEDAVAAVETYHNRQLDGQPMKCLLVKSRSSTTKVGKDIMPDISTVHHALFTK